MDEAAEREEQEILARREQVLLDLAAAQQEATNEEARAEGEDEEMEEGEGERDLDDEVPEAEVETSDLSASEDEASELEEGDTSALGGHTGNLTFNEDSFIEGSMVAAEVEHMLEREEAEMAGVLQDERDLDDDVPEAGSYEHTDSELEESSSEGEANSSFLGRGPAQSIGRRISGRLGSRRRSSGRRSSGLGGARGPRSSILEGSSILDGSSFMRSSPAAARDNLRARIMGPRAPRGG